LLREGGLSGLSTRSIAGALDRTRPLPGLPRSASPEPPFQGTGRALAGKAFRFPKGQSGYPDGQLRFYPACRKLAREASPEMMAGLIDLAKNTVDERVRSVCLVAVLDRAGVRPIDYDPTVDKVSESSKFDPSLYSSEELDVIERVLRLMVDRAGGQEGVEAIGNRGDHGNHPKTTGRGLQWGSVTGSASARPLGPRAPKWASINGPSQGEDE